MVDGFAHGCLGLSHWGDTTYVKEQQMTVVTLPTPVAGANKYVEIPLENTLAPGANTPGLDLSFHHIGWPPMNDTDDYSYQASATFLNNSKITLYYQGNLAWGVEPGGTSATCGNGVVEVGEQCDTAGSSASCDADCTPPSCGDGFVNAQAGENCDPGDNPQCFSNCSGLPCTNPAQCLHVMYDNFSDDSQYDQQVKVAFKIVNNGTTAINLNQLTLRYWIKYEPPSYGGFIATCNWAALGCSIIRPLVSFTTLSPAKPTADRVWTFGFQNAGTLQPGQNTGSITIYGQNTAWNNLNDTNDYSYKVVSGDFVVTTTIAAYLNGNRVWGVEP